MPTASSLAWKTSLKSQDAVALQQIKERGATYDWSWWYPSGTDRCSNIWASLPGAGYGQFEHKADSLIAKFKEAGGTVREIDVWAESPRLSPAFLVICIIVCSSWPYKLIITVITPLISTKPSATKNARELEVTNAAITDMQMRQRDVAALDAKYTKELADAKAENDALRDDAAAGRQRRLHIKAVCQSVWSHRRLRRG